MQFDASKQELVRLQRGVRELGCSPKMSVLRLSRGSFYMHLHVPLR